MRGKGSALSRNVPQEHAIDLRSQPIPRGSHQGLGTVPKRAPGTRSQSQQPANPQRLPPRARRAGHHRASLPRTSGLDRLAWCEAKSAQSGAPSMTWGTGACPAVTRPCSPLLADGHSCLLPPPRARSGAAGPPGRSGTRAATARDSSARRDPTRRQPCIPMRHHVLPHAEPQRGSQTPSPMAGTVKFPLATQRKKTSTTSNDSF